MTVPAIQVRNLGKRYRIGAREPYKTLRDAIARAAGASVRTVRSGLSGRPNAQPSPSRDRYIWALRNVSLDVEEGQAVGIIGPNGAGKTTLLRILSRITEPTEGSAAIRGRVGSLLEVGTGFHQELTGRENVYLNGAILGMTKKEIDNKFDAIVGFAEIERFIDTPVKRYSDGMRVRLGFAVAAHLEPEIILVDEVLAVGDAAFQRKCTGKMEDIANEGRTVLFVSHNMAAIQNLCTVAYGLDHGKMFASGEVNDVIAQYLEAHDRPSAIPLRDRTDRAGSERLRLAHFSISGAISSTDIVQCGAPAAFEIAYEGAPPLRDVEISMLFYSQFGLCVLEVGTNLIGKTFVEIPARGTFVCRFDKFPLLPGIYHVDIGCDVRGVTADWIKNAVTIHVVEGDYYGSGKLPPKGSGIVATPHDWDVTD